MIYQNPENLFYFLFNKKVPTLQNQVIKKENIDIPLGKCEVAIIGSSHYFYLENYFFELLTCSDLNYSDDSVKQKIQITDNLNFRYSENKLNYEIKIEIISYNKSEFYIQEKRLLKKKSFLIHAFEKESALTVIDFNYHDFISLKTWHTYPESYRIVVSKTKISLTD